MLKAVEQHTPGLGSPSSVGLTGKEKVLVSSSVALTAAAAAVFGCNELVQKKRCLCRKQVYVKVDMLSLVQEQREGYAMDVKFSLDCIAEES